MHSKNFKQALFFATVLLFGGNLSAQITETRTGNPNAVGSGNTNFRIRYNGNQVSSAPASIDFRIGLQVVEPVADSTEVNVDTTSVYIQTKTENNALYQAKTDTSTYDASRYFVINRFQQDSDTTGFDATKNYVLSRVLNDLSDVSVAGAPAGRLLVKNSGGLWVDSTLAGVTPDTVENLPGSGTKLYKGMSGASFMFKRLKGSTGQVNITDNADSVTIDFDPNFVELTSGWKKATNDRIEPRDLTDTVRVNLFRLGTSSTSGQVVKAINSFGNAAYGTVDSAGITDGAITSLKIKAGNVNTSDLADDAVLSSKIGSLSEFLIKPDMLEFLGGALQGTASAGASDTTANYAPMKAFSVNDSATFDISTSKRFASIDSIVILAYSNTATSNVVFNCQIRQIQIGGAIAGAFNAATSKTIATGTAGTLKQWSFTSFGSVTASAYSEIIGKIYRTTGGTGGDVFVRRVLIYGVGLR